jgi:integrase
MAREQKGWFRRKKGSLVYCYISAEGRERSIVIGPASLQNHEGWLKVGERGLNKLVGKPEEHKYTLGEVTALYLAYGKKKTGEDKAESTKELHAQLVRSYIEPEFGDRVAMMIEPLEIQNWIDGLSKGIRAKVRNLMSAIYRYGQKMSKIPRREECNPMRWVSAGTTSDYEAVVVTPEQAWSIAENLPLYERTLVITEAATACRISECLALKWFDIEWGRNQIRVQRAWVRGRIGPTKSKASKAPVPMHPILAAILENWRKETPYAKDNDWVFPSFKLKGTQPRTASTIVADYIRPTATKLGIIKNDERRFGFHNFRHSLATFLISEGRNLDVVRRMLRQSHIDTTLLYVNMDSERIGAQGRMLDRMLPKIDAVQ